MDDRGPNDLEKIIDSVKIPIGRRIRQAIITEAKRMAAKAKRL